MNPCVHPSCSILALRRFHSRRIGLTLVETAAIVVAVCAVLAVIVPALGETRRRGKDTVCIQNLHRIAQASHVYSGRDATVQAIPIPPAVMDASRIRSLASYGWGGKSGLGETGAILSSLFGPAFDMAASDRPLNRILFRDDILDIAQINPRPGAGGSRWLADARLALDIYRCPSDSGYTGLHTADGFDASPLTSYDFFRVSYAAHRVLVLLNSYDLPCELGSNTPLLHPLSSIVNPSRTIPYQENAGLFGWRAVPTQPAVCFVQTEGEANGWHGKTWTFHAAFVDGRVGSIFMRGFTPEPIAHSPVGVSATECITIRGDGWQVDTLPAPLTRTGLVCMR